MNKCIYAFKKMYICITIYIYINLYNRIPYLPIGRSYIYSIKVYHI